MMKEGGTCSRLDPFTPRFFLQFATLCLHPTAAHSENERTGILERERVPLVVLVLAVNHKLELLTRKSVKTTG